MSLPEFRDAGLLELALTHASTGATASNERLEFLGDAALGLIIAQYLYENCPQLDEGELTERKARLVARVTLARAARAAQLEQHARLGKGMLGKGMQGQALPVSVQANLYEAVLGALLLDSGLEAARAFVLRTLEEDLRIELGDGQEVHPKQALQHWAQARGQGLPEYELLEERGEAHAKAFLMRVNLGGVSFPGAWGRNRREAESHAAREALLVLRSGDQQNGAAAW